MNTRTVVLWHNNGEERIYFTVNSAEINVSRSNQNWVLSLAMERTVNVWGGRGLRAVTLETFLPSENSPFYAGQPPEAVLAMLKRWQDSGDPVRLILSESDINDAFLLEDVSEILREGDRDVGVSITLREYKFKSALAALAGGDAPPARTDERTPQKSYTVKKGVTLWEMACRFYGDGARWGELASRNGVSDPRKLPVGKVLEL
ncbi:MAG: LysM peptidoglycan-binding domain-containing protein [Oscillibacter sp.]|nr:LysM peptidoglycan-binding domain-containing protein [Oscillibacter sp.]